MTYKEEADYEVTATVRVRIIIGFSEMERDGRLTKQDAIDNTLGGGLGDALLALRGDGFSTEVVAWEVDRVSYIDNSQPCRTCGGSANDLRHLFGTGIKEQA